MDNKKLKILLSTKNAFFVCRIGAELIVGRIENTADNDSAVYIQDHFTRHMGYKAAQSVCGN